MMKLCNPNTPLGLCNLLYNPHHSRTFAPEQQLQRNNKAQLSVLKFTLRISTFIYILLLIGGVIYGGIMQF